MRTTKWVREALAIVVYSTGRGSNYVPLGHLKLFRDVDTAQAHPPSETPRALLAVYDARATELHPLGYAWQDEAGNLHGTEQTKCARELLAHDWHFGPWEAATSEGLLRTYLRNGGSVEALPEKWQELARRLSLENQC